MPRTKLGRPGATPLAPYLPRPFVPTSLFPSLTRSLGDLQERTNEMIRSAFAGLPELPAFEWFPAVNMSEGKDEFTLTAELPGLAAKDVSIDYCDGVLTIRGEKEQEETKKEDDRKYYMWERRFGSFQRSFPFPGGIDESKITAEFKDGVLTVHMAKAEEAKAKHQTIAIQEK
jgi:HSP20 family protein